MLEEKKKPVEEIVIKLLKIQSDCINKKRGKLV